MSIVFAHAWWYCLTHLVYGNTDLMILIADGWNIIIKRSHTIDMASLKNIIRSVTDSVTEAYKKVFGFLLIWALMPNWKWNTLKLYINNF